MSTKVLSLFLNQYAGFLSLHALFHPSIHPSMHPPIHPSYMHMYNHTYTHAYIYTCMHTFIQHTCMSLLVCYLKQYHLDTFFLIKMAHLPSESIHSETEQHEEGILIEIEDDDAAQRCGNALQLLLGRSPHITVRNNSRT